jgi:PAS domain S-box-containing protein
MSRTMHPRLRIYLLSLAALALALLIRRALDPVLGLDLPLVTLFGAVAAATWLGGYRPAVLVTVLGYLAANVLFMEPRGVFYLTAPGRPVGMIAYLFTCALIIGFGEAMRRAQARANERRDVLGVTLKSIGDAVITTDTSGRVVTLNPVAETLTGWSEAEAIGRPLEQVFHIVDEDSRQPIEGPAVRAIRDGDVVGLANHALLIRKDGSECAIDDSAAPIRDENGHVSGCVLIFRDVTGARRRELKRTDQLHAARLLAAIVESSDDAIISKSLDGIIQTWNRGAERLFGYRADEAVGRHISLVIPPDRIGEEDTIIAHLKAGLRIDHFETERVRSDGTRIFVSLTISPIADHLGRVTGASKIVRDITERKRIEADREQLADDLRRTAADLSEANRRKDEFLSLLAHELRNPLAPISNAVQALRMGDAAGATVRDTSALLERQVRQLSRLVDDLLDMSRITRGRIELRKEHIALAPVVNDVVEAARISCEAMNHELTVSMPEEPLTVDADPVRLAQVIGNLLNNAVKFTDRGGHIDLRVERDGEHAIIRVRDNGIGIDLEQQGRIFDMFSQVDTSLERSRDGLGIGLTLVKALAEQHGGSVTALSEGLGRGSEFVVRLPLVDPESVTIPAVPADLRSAGRSLVLIVDDNEDSGSSLALLLELCGHEAHAATDGIEGLALAERLRPDLVLLDIGLPGLNGYEVCRRMREEPWGKDLIIAALTGWGKEEDRNRSREAGFSAHLVKPIELATLLRLLAGINPPGETRPASSHNGRVA